MKNTEDVITAQDIYTLAQTCKVSITKACAKAHVHSATPARWKRMGHKPDQTVARRLVSAIMDMAREAGTLPSEYQAPARETIGSMRDECALLAIKIRNISARLKVVEASLG